MQAFAADNTEIADYSVGTAAPGKRPVQIHLFFRVAVAHLQSPEVAAHVFNLGKHIFKRAQRAVNSVVCKDKLVIFFQPVIADIFDAVLVSPGVKALVFPCKHIIAYVRKVVSAFGSQLAVYDHKDIVAYCAQLFQIVEVVFIGDAVFVVKEQDTGTFHLQ